MVPCCGDDSTYIVSSLYATTVINVIVATNHENAISPTTKALRTKKTYH
jgi:hypothetical protein